MAITSNEDLVVTYDDGGLIVSARILEPTDTPEREHAAQCLAIEGLRTILGMGITVTEYNNMDDPTWQAVIVEAVARARLNVIARIHELTPNEWEQAVNVGGSSYFEAGYVAFMAGVSQTERVTFTRTGGM